MKLLTNYIIALTQFYGLVTPEIVVAMYNQQNEHQIIEEDVYTILRKNYVNMTYFQKDIYLYINRYLLGRTLWSD